MPARAPHPTAQQFARSHLLKAKSVPVVAADKSPKGCHQKLQSVY